MQINKKRGLLIAASLAMTFGVFRLSLYFSPNTDLNLGPYNIHHLYIGLILITFSAIPLAIFHGNSRLLDAAAVTFGIGLSMALDEWVYLIVTDGSNAAYLLPISFWGGILMVGLACTYVLLLLIFCKKVNGP